MRRASYFAGGGSLRGSGFSLVDELLYGYEDGLCLLAPLLEPAASVTPNAIEDAKDRDDAGSAHAREIARSLIGVASSVRVVEALTGKDASDPRFQHHLGCKLSMVRLVTQMRREQSTIGILAQARRSPPQ
jgi:hypothetical protein